MHAGTNPAEVCPLLAYLYQNGNTSVHKYFTVQSHNNLVDIITTCRVVMQNEDPPVEEAVVASVVSHQEQPVEIDWGDAPTTLATDDGILS